MESRRLRLRRSKPKPFPRGPQLCLRIEIVDGFVVTQVQYVCCISQDEFPLHQCYRKSAALTLHVDLEMSRGFEVRRLQHLISAQPAYTVRRVKSRHQETIWKQLCEKLFRVS